MTIAATPDEVWDLAFNVNVRAHILAARRLVPGWLERSEGCFVSSPDEGVWTGKGGQPSFAWRANLVRSCAKSGHWPAA